MEDSFVLRINKLSEEGLDLMKPGNPGEILCEYGGIPKFRIPDSVRMYDEEGNEIEIPKCEKCGGYKTQIIGKNCSALICWICEVRGKDEATI